MASYDYIVLGAGSAGCVLAARLSADPNRRVLVLEAGGMDGSVLYRKPGLIGVVFETPALKARADWGYHTVAQRGLGGREIPYTRGRILGGCSTVNGMLYVRGNRQNFDDWGADNPGWSYSDVLPLFRRSEGHEDGESEYHGGEGPLRVTLRRHISPPSRAFVEAASLACGVPVVDDFNGAQQEGAGFYQQTIFNRERCSTATAFLRPALGRPNLELRTGALVERIVIENGRAVGVLYRHGSESLRADVEGEVLCCMGAIGSPQVLMLSGLGPADHLRQLGVKVVQDLPVGENFHDQLYVPMRFFAPEAGHRSSALHFASGMFQEFVLRRGWMSETFIDGGAFVRSSPDARLPDVQYHVVPWAYPEPNTDHPGTIRPDPTPSLTLLPTLLYPRSRGSVRLRSSAPEDKPLIDPAYLEHPDDLALLLRAYRLTREIAATEPLAGMLRGEAAPGAQIKGDAELGAEIRQRAHTVYHPVGTCRMAPGSDGVVDHLLRVKGIAGLRVADASIMPEVTGGNTNAASIMIGEKCAELLS
jgi:choline dehydrogenase-like flavoprotein